MNVEKIVFDDYKEFFNYFLNWNENLEGFVFRGHSSEKYKLIPTALREDFKSKIIPPKEGEEYKGFDDEYGQIHAEFTLLRDFYKSADLQGLRVPHSPFLRRNLASDISSIFFKFTTPGHNLEWIPTEMDELAALAQHYGIPTRLLDWTHDPFIALHFALRGAFKKEGNLAIWCINKAVLSLHFEASSHEGIRFITPPYFDNPNLNAQKGIFTHIPVMPKTTRGISHDRRINRESLDEILARFLAEKPVNPSFSSNIFKMVTLPCSVAIEAYIALEKHGYGLERIFPGYEGVAKQVLEKTSLHYYRRPL